MKKLFTFGRFAYDPQSILATVYGLALVGVKLSLNVIAFESGVTSFADAKSRGTLFHDPQLALWHDSSLAQWEGRA
jgi:hypothetical protein